jgi:hypothetical protein
MFGIYLGLLTPCAVFFTLPLVTEVCFLQNKRIGLFSLTLLVGILSKLTWMATHCWRKWMGFYYSFTYEATTRFWWGPSHTVSQMFHSWAKSIQYLSVMDLWEENLLLLNLYFLLLKRVQLTWTVWIVSLNTCNDNRGQQNIYLVKNTSFYHWLTFFLLVAIC